MSRQKEIRVLHIEVPEPQNDGGRLELREIKIWVAFSDGSWSQIKTLTSMKQWPSADLIETVKNFVAEIERAEHLPSQSHCLKNLFR